MADGQNKENTIDNVMSQVLQPTGLDERHISNALGSLNLKDVDIADLYFQVSRQESWSVEDGKLKEGSFNLDQGVGVRAVCGEKTGFAYSDELLIPSLEQAASAARAISPTGRIEIRADPGERSSNDGPLSRGGSHHQYFR